MNTNEANKVYQTLQTEVDMLIHQLQEKLAIQAMAQAKNPTNWGFVGDLGRIKSNLNDILA